VREGVSRRLDEVIVERIPFFEKGEGVRVGGELVEVWIVIVDGGVDDGDGVRICGWWQNPGRDFA